jgi:hypothetical protein
MAAMPQTITPSVGHLNGSRTWSAPHVVELPPDETLQVRTKLGCTTFDLYAPLLLQGGYSPLPIEPGSKRPLGALGDWARLRTTPLTLDEVATIAAHHPDAGLGVVGGFSNLVPIDVDAEDETIIAAINTALPPPLVSKRGRRGVTHIYRSCEAVRARKFCQTDGAMMVEILSTGQTVIPPTPHPETEQPYRWIDDDLTLLTVSADELPEISAAHIAGLEAALGPWMAPRREYVPRHGTNTEPICLSRMRAYAEAALAAEASALRGMPKDSGRNRRLFDAGCKLGRYVQHQVLTKAELEGALVEACCANGLLAEDGQRACERTLESGLRKAEGDDLPVLEDYREKKEPSSGMTQTNEHGSVEERGGKRTQADRLIEISTRGNVELYHAPDGTAYADLVINGHRETWPLKSPGFRGWLRRAYYLETGGAPNGEAMATAMGVIEARARFDGANRAVHLRVAEHGEHIYLDLCDDRWRAIEISADGWRIVDAPRVRFRRSAGMLPIPDPVRGGRVEEIRRHLHVGDADYVLVVSWLLQVLRGRGPYPILALTGEQGTGKSLLADMLRQLLDPHAASLRSPPRDTRELYVAAINGHVLVFDNLSSISTDMADSLCRLSTGGGFSTRALYTDSDEVIFSGQRPIALTSINDVASRSDLADRSLIVRLMVIPDVECRPEEELRAAFEEDRPRILGALLDVVSHGLMQLPHTRLNRLPRMADYAIWVRACEEAIWSAGMHLAAYEANRADAGDVVLESDPVATALRQHMEGRSEHTTTAAELLAALGPLVSDHVRRGRQWPGSARGLSGQLTRLGPALRRAGIRVEHTREAGSGGRRLIHVTREDRP